MTGGIFISYRRDDSAGYAGRLYDRLAARFGSKQVFMDVEGIEPGTDFVDAIENAVGACAVLIVLIGDEWLSASDAAGKRRLDDPNDFIRLETATALTRQIRVVPVLVDGTPMPPTDSLPEDLRMLTRRQAVEISHKQWEASTGELIRTLERILEAPAAPPPATPAANPGRPAGAGRPPVAALTAVLGAVLAGLAWFYAGRPGPAPDTAPAVAVTNDAEAPSGSVPSSSTSSRQPRLVTLAPGLDFGAAAVGSSRAGAVRFGNEGTAPARLAKARLEGDDAASFRIVVSTCVGDLAPGRTCEINLAYQPLSPASRRATLVVALADASQQVSVELVGTATAPPSPVPSPTAEPAEAAKDRKLSVAGKAASADAAAAAADGRPPQIVAWRGISEEGGGRLCYRTSLADEVELTPKPGVLEKTAGDCVRVALDAPTRFTLVARNSAGTTRKSLLLSPKPSSVARAPAESAAPAAGATAQEPAITDRRRPLVGEQWHYRSSGKWPTSPKRSFTITARAVTSGTVQDQFQPIEPATGGAGESRGSTAAPGFVNWNEIGSEFSPYLAAFEPLAEGHSWRDLPTPDQAYWTQWYSEARVLGSESITVPAGRYVATKVEVWSSRRATGSRAEAQLEPVRVHYLVWYVPELKRYARMQRRVVSANGTELENDLFELVAHKGG